MACRLLPVALFVACVRTATPDPPPPITAAPPSAAPVAHADPTLIPRSVLWGNAERSTFPD